MSNATTIKQPWLRSPFFDCVYLLFPGFVALLITAFLPDKYKYSDASSLVGWVVFVLLVDVSHVYSTLFLTYFDKRRFANNRTLFLIVPLACYISGVMLYAVDALVFWRVLAYLAVFHFIRQQYGMMRLYARYELKGTWQSRIDVIAVYAATLYPLLYWHCTTGRHFNWFVDGDFMMISNAEGIKNVSLYLYVAIITAYVLTEIVAAFKQGSFNVPKNVVIIGTFVSWYFGIIYFNGDMAFTILNVVAHGVPYMALIWMFRKKEERSGGGVNKVKLTLLFFLTTMFAFAFVEEGLWDGLVWREHTALFGIFSWLPMLNSSPLLALLIPLLSLPQSTHYVLDGLIWRKNGIIR